MPGLRSLWYPDLLRLAVRLNAQRPAARFHEFIFNLARLYRKLNNARKEGVLGLPEGDLLGNRNISGPERIIPQGELQEVLKETTAALAPARGFYGDSAAGVVRHEFRPVEAIIALSALAALAGLAFVFPKTILTIITLPFVLWAGSKIVKYLTRYSLATGIAGFCATVSLVFLPTTPFVAMALFGVSVISAVSLAIGVPVTALIRRTLNIGWSKWISIGLVAACGFAAFRNFTQQKFSKALPRNWQSLVRGKFVKRGIVKKTENYILFNNGQQLVHFLKLDPKGLEFTLERFRDFKENGGLKDPRVALMVNGNYFSYRKGRSIKSPVSWDTLGGEFNETGPNNYPWKRAGALWMVFGDGTVNIMPAPATTKAGFEIMVANLESSLGVKCGYQGGPIVMIDGQFTPALSVNKETGSKTLLVRDWAGNFYVAFEDDLLMGKGGMPLESFVRFSTTILKGIWGVECKDATLTDAGFRSTCIMRYADGKAFESAPWDAPLNVIVARTVSAEEKLRREELERARALQATQRSATVQQQRGKNSVTPALSRRGNKYTAHHFGLIEVVACAGILALALSAAFVFIPQTALLSLAAVISVKAVLVSASLVLGLGAVIYIVNRKTSGKKEVGATVATISEEERLTELRGTIVDSIEPDVCLMIKNLKGFAEMVEAAIADKRRQLNSRPKGDIKEIKDGLVILERVLYETKELIDADNSEARGKILASSNNPIAKIDELCVLISQLKTRIAVIRTDMEGSPSQYLKHAQALLVILENSLKLTVNALKVLEDKMNKEMEEYFLQNTANYSLFSAQDIVDYAIGVDSSRGGATVVTEDENGRVIQVGFDTLKDALRSSDPYSILRKLIDRLGDLGVDTSRYAGVLEKQRARVVSLLEARLRLSFEAQEKKQAVLGWLSRVRDSDKVCDALRAVNEVAVKWGLLSPEEALSDIYSLVDEAFAEFNQALRPHLLAKGLKEESIAEAMSALEGIRVRLNSKYGEVLNWVACARTIKGFFAKLDAQRMLSNICSMGVVEDGMPLRRLVVPSSLPIKCLTLLTVIAGVFMVSGCASTHQPSGMGAAASPAIGNDTACELLPPVIVGDMHPEIYPVDDIMSLPEEIGGPASGDEEVVPAAKAPEVKVEPGRLSVNILGIYALNANEADLKRLQDALAAEYPQAKITVTPYANNTRVDIEGEGISTREAFVDAQGTFDEPRPINKAVEAIKGLMPEAAEVPAKDKAEAAQQRKGVSETKAPVEGQARVETPDDSGKVEPADSATAQNAQAAQVNIRGPPAVELNSTVLVDNAPFYGLTADPQTFTKEDAPRVIGNALRFYYPVPLDLLKEIIANNNIRVIEFTLPLSAKAYTDNPTMRSYYGRGIPAPAERVSLEAGNYLDYIAQALEITKGKAVLIVSLGNEYNLYYADWFKKPVDDYFVKVDEASQEIHKRFTAQAAGRELLVSVVLGDRPEHFAGALRTDVDIIGVNVYRPIAEVIRDYQSNGKVKPFYVAEAGQQSVAGDMANQSSVVRGIWLEAERLKSSIFFMSYEDNSLKGKDDGWGWFGKPVFEEMSREWSADAQALPSAQPGALDREEMLKRVRDLDASIAALSKATDDEEKARRAELSLEKRVRDMELRIAEAQVDVMERFNKGVKAREDLERDLAYGRARRARVIGLDDKECLTGRVQDLLDKGDRDSNLAVIDALMPYSEEALLRNGEALNPKDASFRDAAYIQASLNILRADFMQLRENYFDVLKGKDGKSKEELLAVYLAFQQNYANTLVDIAKVGDLNIGVNLGGEVGVLVDAINIIYGFAEGEITSGTNIALSAVALYDDLITLYQIPAFRHLKDAGGWIVPVEKEKEGNLEFEILGLGNVRGFNIIGFNLFRVIQAKVGPEIKFGSDLWIAEAELGLDLQNRFRGVLPNLIMNGSLLGDKVYVIRTQYGKYVYFPAVVSKGGENQLEKRNDKDYVDVLNPGECLNKIIISLFKRQSQFKDYPAVYIPSLVQVEAYRLAVTGEDRNMEYWIHASLTTHLQTIYRHDLRNDSWEMVSETPMYFREEDSGEKGKLRNTEAFLRTTGQWPWTRNEEETLYPERLLRIGGASDFDNMDAMFRGVSQGYGFSVDLSGRSVKAFDSPEQIQPSVAALVPVQKSGSFVVDQDGKPLMTTTRINPYTAR